MIPTGRPRHWKVVLVVEDDSDGRALRSLARASGVAAEIDWLPANGIGNIKRRGDSLLRLAFDRLETERGCVAVVVDRDGKVSSRDEPHRSICEACRRAGAEYVEIVEALEAWYLADGGICAWLGISSRRSVDRIRDPKKQVGRAFLKKTRRPYQKRRARQQLATKASGIEARRSVSWSKAIERLAGCGVRVGG